jgi:Tol biopolymer transport system component
VTNHSNPEVNDSADFQAVLFADGQIQFGYQEVKTLGGLAGIAPGGTPNLLPFNFTATPGDGFTFGQDTALYERFTGIAPNPFDLKYSFITYAPQSSGGYEMKFYHAPQTAVTGRLTDGAGNPVGGATVTVLGRSAVSNADGRNLTNLTNNGAYDADAAFSPDRTEIAFDSYRGDPTEQVEDVYVMNADGTGVVNLTNNPADDSYPHWSPDGSKILFYSNRNGRYEIFVMNADGSDQHSLTGYPGDSIPIWSPDGSKILVESDRGGEWRLYVMNADGSDPTPLNGAGNYGGNADDFADWSPDGSKVAFHSYRNGEANIIVVDVGGPNVVNLGPSSIPKWSPDGSKILFDYGDVYVMDADGGNRVRLSEGGAFIAEWSPDGRQVVYNGRYENNSATLLIVNSDGTNRRLLLDNHSLVYVDDWAISPR